MVKRWLILAALLIPVAIIAQIDWTKQIKNIPSFVTNALGDPGANGFVKRTSVNTSTVAGGADVWPGLLPFASLTTGTNSAVFTFTGQIVPAVIGGVQYAANYAGSSSTCGITEAYNALPAAGGQIILQQGTCTMTAGVVIKKPVYIKGQGMGGSTDAGTNNVYIAGTTILNGTTSSDAFSVQLPVGVSASLVGVTFEDFLVIGNKNVGGATAGDNFKIVGGNTAQQVRETNFIRVGSVFAKGNGLTIQDNAFSNRINNSYFNRNATNGILVTTTLATCATPSQTNISFTMIDQNANDGLLVSSACGTQSPTDVALFRSTTADSGVNGIEVTVGAFNTGIKAFDLDCESNTGACIKLRDGYGHFVTASYLLTNAIGIDADFPAGASFALTQLNIYGNNYGSNSTRDISLGANVHGAFIGPQASNNYTYQDLSSVAVVLTPDSNGSLNFTGVGGFQPNTNGGSGLGKAGHYWSNLFTAIGTLLESSAPSGVAGSDVCYADSTAHGIKCSYNNGSFGPLVTAAPCTTSQKTETAADANLLTCAIPAQAGSYRIRFVMDVSAATAATIGWTATWTDSNGTAQAPVNLALVQAGSNGWVLTVGNIANFHGYADVDVNNAGTSIVVKLTFSGTSFAAKASATVERII